MSHPPAKVYFFREWREHAGLTQPQLGDLMGLSKTHISRLENGHRGLTLRLLEQFQQAVGCPEVWTPLAHPPAHEGPSAMKKPVFICSICQRECDGIGNNADPVNDGECCDQCDNEIVIPARIRQMQRYARGKKP